MLDQEPEWDQALSDTICTAINRDGQNEDKSCQKCPTAKL